MNVNFYNQKCYIITDFWPIGGCENVMIEGVKPAVSRAQRRGNRSVSNTHALTRFHRTLLACVLIRFAKSFEI